MLEADLPARAEAFRRADLATLHAELDALADRFADREGALQAFVPEDGRFERLHRELDALATRCDHPAARPPLFAVPVGVKDCLHVDGLPTRVGSRLPPEVLAGPEGGAVARLRAAGALVLGKTVATEFTYFAPGPTRNPRHPEHTPGGSSSGSAAAVGAGLCPLALGTQTIGSITRPAAFCGVVGVKASFDRIAADGLVNLAPSLDHVGFFTADVASALLAATVLVDGWRAATPGHRPVLGLPEGPYLDHTESVGRAHFREIVHRLVDAGFTVRTVDVFRDFEAIRDRHDLIVAAEAAAVHREWFPRYRELYRDKTAALVERGLAVRPDELERARAGREKLRRELEAAMAADGVDLWIAPSAPGPAPRGLDWTGDPVMNLPWTHAGLPTVGLPSGADPAGLPLGLQLAGRFGADEDVLAWAREIERTLG